jgi:peptide-methionine (S)-S-oxide reductase
VTEISPLALFHPAEAYHSDYFAKNPEQGYCQAVVRKKVEKAKEYVGKL